jgi:hypothetical protein
MCGELATLARPTRDARLLPLPAALGTRAALNRLHSWGNHHYVLNKATALTPPARNKALTTIPLAAIAELLTLKLDLDCATTVKIAHCKRDFVDLGRRLRPTNTRTVGLAATRTTLSEHSEKTSEVKWETATPTATERVATKRMPTPLLSTRLPLYIPCHVIDLTLSVVGKNVMGPRNCLEIVLIAPLIWMMLH